MCRPGDQMEIARAFRIFVYFCAKTDPETEVLGREKTKPNSKFHNHPTLILSTCDITIHVLYF